MTRSGLVIVFIASVALAAVLTAATAVTAADDSPAVVHVVATNGYSGPSLSQLSKADLELVTLDGRSLPVRNIARAAPTVLVVIDVSVSVILNGSGSASLWLDTLDRGFFRRLDRTERVRIGAISRVLTLSDGFSSDRAVLIRQTRSVASPDDKLRYGPSPLWDALDEAITAMEKEPGRRAIVLLSDGEATANVKTLQRAIDHASRADVAVSVVGALARLDNARRQLQLLADQTGGRYVDSPGRGSFKDVVGDGLARILDDLHHAYAVEFDLPAGVSAITLRSRSLNAFVRERQLTFEPVP